MAASETPAGVTISIGDTKLTLAPGATATFAATDKGYTITITPPAAKAGAPKADGAAGRAAAPVVAPAPQANANQTQAAIAKPGDVGTGANAPQPPVQPPASHLADASGTSGGTADQPPAPTIPAISVAAAPAPDPATSGSSANKPSTFCTILGFQCGVGVSYTHNFGSERVDSVTAIQQAGGSQVYLQAKTSQNDSAAVLGELHHFFLSDRGADAVIDAMNPRYVRADLTNFRITPLNKDDSTVYPSPKKNEHPLDLIAHDVGALIACGPFAFAPAFDAGCGPVAVAAVSADGKGVTEFGLGWAGGIKSVGGVDGTGFNLGIGMLFDPNEQILDSRIVNPNTRIVLPAYEVQALANPSIALVHRPTHSLFIMISKTVP